MAQTSITKLSIEAFGFLLALFLFLDMDGAIASGIELLLLSS
jgi:hypothetical protein